MDDKTYHKALDVRKTLTLNDTELGKVGLFFFDDGEPLTDLHQIRAALADALANGHRYISNGKCDNFDPMRGCLGHLPGALTDKTESGLVEE